MFTVAAACATAGGTTSMKRSAFVATTAIVTAAGGVALSHIAPAATPIFNLPPDLEQIDELHGLAVYATKWCRSENQLVWVRRWAIPWAFDHARRNGIDQVLPDKPHLTTARIVTIESIFAEKEGRGTHYTRAWHEGSALAHLERALEGVRTDDPNVTWFANHDTLPICEYPRA